jgi:D-serine deaminase-like pyridoxal phosphate-dependent protein
VFCIVICYYKILSPIAKRARENLSRHHFPHILYIVQAIPIAMHHVGGLGIFMLNNIVKPTLLLKKMRALRNIETMINKADGNRVRFRPHFKTHQSAAIESGIKNAALQRLRSLLLIWRRYFVNHGWQDITVAFPVNMREIDKINALAETITLHLLVEAEESVHFLGSRLTSPAKLWIKIDTGYHRTD